MDDLSAFWDHILSVDLVEFGECRMTDAFSANCPVTVRYHVDRGGISLEPVQFGFSSIPTGPLISSYRNTGPVVCEEPNVDDPTSCAVR